MNVTWHSEHPLSRKASLDERIRWHLDHKAICGCRLIPASLQAKIEESK